MKSHSSIPGPELRRSMRRTRVALAMFSAFVVLRAPISRMYSGRRCCLPRVPDAGTAAGDEADLSPLVAFIDVVVVVGVPFNE